MTRTTKERDENTETRLVRAVMTEVYGRTFHSRVQMQAAVHSAIKRVLSATTEKST